MQAEGIIVKGIGGFYYVDAGEAIWECRARGKFRNTKIKPLPGDYVSITVNEDAENTVDTIFPRQCMFVRPPIANVNVMMIVVSTCEPSPNLLLVDRLTAIAKYKGIESRLIITKTDLCDAENLIAIYGLTGIKTYIVSGLTGEGVSGFLDDLAGKIAVFTGNSGVGKSSVLNCIDNALELKTAQISDKLGRGKHTTRHIELFRIGNGYIADTPGFSSLDFESGEHISKEELPFCFEEFVPYLGQCRFSTCSHVKDAGCRILEAVKSGHISTSRHKSYTVMYREVKDRHDWQ